MNLIQTRPLQGAKVFDLMVKTRLFDLEIRGSNPDLAKLNAKSLTNILVHVHVLSPSLQKQRKILSVRWINAIFLKTPPL